MCSPRNSSRPISRLPSGMRGDASLAWHAPVRTRILHIKWVRPLPEKEGSPSGLPSRCLGHRNHARSSASRIAHLAFGMGRAVACKEPGFSACRKGWRVHRVEGAFVRLQRFSDQLRRVEGTFVPSSLESRISVCVLKALTWYDAFGSLNRRSRTSENVPEQVRK